MVPVCFVFRWEFMKFSSDITFVCSSQLYLRHPAPGKAASRSSAESAARHHYGSHKFALFSILKPQSIFSTGIYFRGGNLYSFSMGIYFR